MVLILASCYFWAKSYVKGMDQINEAKETYNSGLDVNLSGKGNIDSGWDMYAAKALVMCKRACSASSLKVKMSEVQGSVYICECGQ